MDYIVDVEKINYADYRTEL